MYRFGYSPIGDHPQTRLRLTGAVIQIPALVCLVFLLCSLGFSFFSPRRSRPLGPSTPLPRALHNNVALPADRCYTEFPLLYPQLEDQVQAWTDANTKRGLITKSMIDKLESAARTQTNWNWARVIIEDGQVYIRGMYKGPDTRMMAMLTLLDEVVKSDPSLGGTSARRGGYEEEEERLPPIDMILTAGDKDQYPPGIDPGPTWVLTRKLASPEKTWLAPDFGFKGWPEASAPTYPEVLSQQALVEEAYPWEKKSRRAFWRGLPNWYPIRKDLMARTREASHAPNGTSQAWADVFATSFYPGDTGPEFRPLVSLPDHCRQKYLLHAEGNSYSGRSKYLLSCHAVTIAHRLEWTQHFHPALDSNPKSKRQNFVQLPSVSDFGGLEETIKALWSMDDSEIQSQVGEGDYISQAKEIGSVDRSGPRQIADRARDMLRDRYLTPAATACYYRAALRAYASVQDVNSWGADGTGPKLKPGNGLKKDEEPGDVSFEMWMMGMRQAYWPPKDGPYVWKAP